ncbi:restriction endonuclease, partial [Lutibacter sp. B1]|nr:restriction endonuclease [Lutibacter sp. B1]
GKNANEISSSFYQNGYYELRCKHEEIRYVDSNLITKNKEIAERWKVFMSKSNGAAGLLTDNNEVSILGKPYIAKPMSACTDSLIPIGNFETEFEATALASYIKTKFLRFMVGILKTSQNILQNVYQFVPLQDFTPESDINWSSSIEDIDKQLYEKYNLSKEEIEFIDKMIKPM